MFGTPVRSQQYPFLRCTEPQSFEFSKTMDLNACPKLQNSQCDYESCELHSDKNRPKSAQLLTALYYIYILYKKNLHMDYRSHFDHHRGRHCSIVTHRRSAPISRTTRYRVFLRLPCCYISFPKLRGPFQPCSALFYGSSDPSPSYESG